MVRSGVLVALVAVLALAVSLLLVVRSPADAGTRGVDATTAGPPGVTARPSLATPAQNARRALEASRGERAAAAAVAVEAARVDAKAAWDRGELPLPRWVVPAGFVLLAGVVVHNATRPHRSDHDPTDPRLSD
jgi:hypothetical protein